jgi:hypothetical protein
VDLDQAADRLYGVPPGEFVTARAELERQARDAGDVRLAREIAKLRRPTVAAWAINQVARQHPQELDDLLDLGERLRAAWREQDADALAELTRRRPEVTSRLARLIRETAERAGHPLAGSAANEVEQTLDAATVDPDAAEQVRQGRLVRTLSYSGFAPAPVASTPRTERPPARARARSGAKADAEAGARAGEDAEARRAAERERRRGEQESAAADAERAAAEAERDHAEWAAELARAEQDQEERTGQVGDLEARLAAARDLLSTAERRLAVVRRDELRARNAAASARRRADQARRALDEPPREGR